MYESHRSLSMESSLPFEHKSVPNSNHNGHLFLKRFECCKDLRGHMFNTHRQGANPCSRVLSGLAKALSVRTCTTCRPFSNPTRLLPAPCFASVFPLCSYLVSIPLRVATPTTCVSPKNLALLRFEIHLLERKTTLEFCSRRPLPRVTSYPLPKFLFFGAASFLRRYTMKASVTFDFVCGRMRNRTCYPTPASALLPRTQRDKRLLH